MSERFEEAREADVATANANKAREVLLVALRDDNVISEESFKVAISEYVVVVVRPSWLGVVYRRIFGAQTDELVYTAVRARKLGEVRP